MKTKPKRKRKSTTRPSNVARHKRNSGEQLQRSMLEKYVGTAGISNFLLTSLWRGELLQTSTKEKSMDGYRRHQQHFVNIAVAL